MSFIITAGNTNAPSRAFWDHVADVGVSTRDDTVVSGVLRLRTRDCGVALVFCSLALQHLCFHTFHTASVGQTIAVRAIRTIGAIIAVRAVRAIGAIIAVRTVRAIATVVAVCAVGTVRAIVAVAVVVVVGSKLTAGLERRKKDMVLAGGLSCCCEYPDAAKEGCLLFRDGEQRSCVWINGRQRTSGFSEMEKRSPARHAGSYKPEHHVLAWKVEMPEGGSRR